MSNIPRDYFKMSLVSPSELQKEQSHSRLLQNCFPFGTNSSFLPFNSSPNSFEAKPPETHLVTESLLLNVPKTPINSRTNTGLSTTGTASKKRAKSKSGSCNRKKSKMKHNSAPEDEINLDTDLFAIVGSIEQDKKLDSDSSRDTLIIDDANDTATFQELSSNSLNRHKTDNMFKFSNYSNNPNVSFLSSLKNTLNEGTIAASNSLNMSDNFGYFAATPRDSDLKKKIVKRSRKTKKKSVMCDSQSKEIFSQDNKNDSSALKMTKKLPLKNSQSVYASMGLDEDLCDVKTSKIEEKSGSDVDLSTSKSNFQNFCRVPIKIEKDSPLEIEQNKISKVPNLSANDMHISMTFEADPYDEEDDLPLSFLKDKLYVDETDSEAKLKFTTSGNASCADLPTFIKQELIDDDILSVNDCKLTNSKEVISGNEALTQSKNYSYFEQYKEPPVNLNSSKTASSNFSLLPVKIKTEPNSKTEYFDSPVTSSGTYVDAVSKTVKKSKYQKKDQNKNFFVNDSSNFSIVSNHALCNKNLAATDSSTNQIINNINISGATSKYSDINLKNFAENQIFNHKLSQPEYSPCLSYDQIQNESAQNSPKLCNNSESVANKVENIVSKTYKAVAKKKVLRKARKPSQVQTDANISCKNIKISESTITQSNLTVESSEIPNDNLVTKCSISDRKNETASNGEKKISDNYENAEKSDCIIPSTSLNIGSFENSNANIVTECNIPFVDSEIFSKKKGNKKKIVKKSMNLDENLPITLLIKRQKSVDTNAQSSDSFLCTVVAESNKNESLTKNLPNNLQTLVPAANFLPCGSFDLEESLKLSKNQLLADKIDISPSDFPNFNSAQNSVKKNKSAPKKKPAKKKNSTSNKNMVKETLNNSSKPLSNLLSNIQIPETCESSFDKKTCSLGGEIKSASETVKDKNVNTLVYMSFEEQPSPREETSEEYLSTILSIKKEMDDSLNSNSTQISQDLIATSSVVKYIKKEKHIIANSGSKAIEQLETVANVEQTNSTTLINLISEVSSELSSSTSNLNFKDVSNSCSVNDSDQVLSKSSKSNSPVKKKKRARRSNNWCKKKKSKTKVKNLSVLATNNISPVSEINTIAVETNNVAPITAINTEFSAVAKEPVVLVKNIPLDNLKLAANHLEENQESSMLAVPETVPLSSKHKTKKKGNSRKRKRASTKEGSLTKELIPEATECRKNVLDNSRNAARPEFNSFTISEENFGSLTPMNTDSGSSNKKTVNTPCDDLLQDKSNKITTVEDSSIKSPVGVATTKKLLFPTLNIATLQKDIEDLECFAAEKRRYCAAEKLKQNSSKEVFDNNMLSEFEMTETQFESSTVLSSSVCTTTKSVILPSSCNLSNVSASESNSFSSKSSSLEGTSVETNNSNLCKQLTEIKKENYNNSPDLISFVDPHDILAKNKSTSNRRQNFGNSLLPKNLVSVKKEMSLKDSDDQFRNSSFSFAKAYNSNLAATNPLISQDADKALKVNSSHSPESDVLRGTGFSHQFYNSSFSFAKACNSNLATTNPLISQNADKALKVNSSHSPESDVLRGTGFSQTRVLDISDEVAFNIKKEVSLNTKSGSSEYGFANAIRNQDDLIERSSKIHEHAIGISALSNSKISPSSLALLPKQSLTVQQKFGIESIVDDEIQVLEVEPKDVPCVDLTEDNLHDLNSEIQSPINSSKIENIKSSIKSNQLTINNTDITEKDSISMHNENQQVLMPGTNLELSLSDGDEVQSQLHHESNDMLPTLDKDVHSLTERETINPLVVIEKYKNEYFKYPFPPSVKTYYKSRCKSKTYVRIDSESLNLSIEIVESRLKNSDNIKYQFGNKLGDVVKLEKYPVSSSEVECYHRILGVAPSHKLLSKCFKSDITPNTLLSKKFNVCESDNTNNLENKQPNTVICSLHDIIQGITECRRMSIDPGLKTSEICDRDCPSADTRDSFESHVSSISEMNLVQKKDLMNFGAKEFELSNLQLDTNSSGRNSALSCAASDFQDSTKNESTGLSFLSPRNTEEQLSNSLDVVETCSNNMFSYLSLPSKEVLDSIVNNNLIGKTVSADEMPDQSNIKTSELRKQPLLDKSHLVPNAYEQVAPVLSPTVNSYVESDANDNIGASKNVASSVLNIDVLGLRKILEVAASIPSATHNENNMWKSKETFDYNHTQSNPVVDMNSENNLKVFDTCSTRDTIEDRSNTVTSQDDSKMEYSDDDYIDNEPIHCELDTDKSEMTDVKVKNNEEHEIPQYKSRWEKIMERKSLENKNKEKVDERFPVSTKVTNKKLKISDDSTKKSSQKKPEYSMTKGKIHTKSKDAKKKRAESEFIEKYKGKNVTKTDVKTKDSKKVSKLKHKHKKEKIKDVTSDLFAPDKPIKKTDERKDIEGFDKTEDGSQSKRFYGNRVTNRGTFLTESASTSKTIKIPKKKKVDLSKKVTHVRSEEFHSLVKSPDINIESNFASPYKTMSKNTSYGSFKNNEFCKTASSMNSFSSSLCHLPDKNKLQNNKAAGMTLHSADFHSYQDNRKTTLSRMASSSLLPNDESIPSKSIAVSFRCNDEVVRNRKVSNFNSPSIPFQLKDDGLPNRKISLSSNPLSNSCEFPTSNPFSSEKVPPISLLQSIISSVKLNDSSIATSNLLPFSEKSDFVWNNNQLSSFSHFNKFTDSNHPTSTKDSSFSSTYGSDLPSTSGNLLNSIPRPSQFNYPFQNQFDPSFNSQGLNPSILTSNNSSQVLCQTPKKSCSTCLVPQHLKSLVGRKAIETSNVRLLMLEWSVDWLVQQQKIYDPPPIYNTLKKVVSSYDSFEDHYNTYFPLMMLDTWHRIYVSWTHLSQHTPHWCNITSYSVKNTYVSVECQTIFNSTIHPKGVFPDEGSILMIKYGTKTKDYNIKILGYVTSVKTRRFNPITDSKLCNNFKPPKDGNFDVFQVLTLSYMGAYNSEDIDKQLPIRIHVLCNVKSTLKQNDALLYISKSPLLRSILNPVEAELLSFCLTPRNSPQEKINECVRDITKGILSPHPLPLLTIVKAVPQSDRLNIIPLLIEKMKDVYKTKVLLCVRTVRALGDIAANICLHDSLKLVIVNKRGDTSPQFQKYLLDELVTSKMHSTDETTENLHSRNEMITRTKKHIFKECDVILSLIRNCHDEFMEATFRETESVAQMCCIVDEANLCTEPESLIPILHGISKLILIGYPESPAKVLSKTASSFDYSRSFFHRAHDLDLITE